MPSGSRRRKSASLRSRAAGPSTARRRGVLRFWQRAIGTRSSPTQVVRQAGGGRRPDRSASMVVALGLSARTNSRPPMTPVSRRPDSGNPAVDEPHCNAAGRAARAVPDATSLRTPPTQRPTDNHRPSAGRRRACSPDCPCDGIWRATLCRAPAANGPTARARLCTTCLWCTVVDMREPVCMNRMAGVVNVQGDASRFTCRGA